MAWRGEGYSFVAFCLCGCEGEVGFVADNPSATRTVRQTIQAFIHAGHRIEYRRDDEIDYPASGCKRGAAPAAAEGGTGGDGDAG